MLRATENKLSHLLKVPTRLVPTIENAWKIAASNPHALFHFMKGLVDFNFYAAPSATILAANIKLAQKYGLCFDQTASPVDIASGAADHSGEIAQYVFAALPDEYGKSSDVLNHRTLALALLSTIGDYASLSNTKRNYPMAKWHVKITDNLQALYQGNVRDKPSLVRAIGAHWGSERLANIEYATGDRIVRHEFKGTGFDKFLTENYSDGKMSFGTCTLDPWTWIKAHGAADHDALEMEHFENAQNAVNILLRYPGHESPRQIWEWICEGALEFSNLQNSFFINIARECRKYE